MAGKGRASVNDMKRVEVQVLMEIAQQSEDNGGFYGFSRKTLAERVGCPRIAPARQLNAWNPKTSLRSSRATATTAASSQMVFVSRSVASGI